MIDVAHIMGLPDKHMLPLLRVIVWKTLSQIREMKRSLVARGQELHWLISIDEAHKIMKTPYGATFIADLQKMAAEQRWRLALVKRTFGIRQLARPERSAHEFAVTYLLR